MCGCERECVSEGKCVGVRECVSEGKCVGVRGNAEVQQKLYINTCNQK